MRGAAKANIIGFYGQQGRIGFKANPYPPELQKLSQLSFGVTAALCGIRRAKTSFPYSKAPKTVKGGLAALLNNNLRLFLPFSAERL